MVELVVPRGSATKEAIGKARGRGSCLGGAAGALSEFEMGRAGGSDGRGRSPAAGVREARDGRAGGSRQEGDGRCATAARRRQPVVLRCVSSPARHFSQRPRSRPGVPAPQAASSTAGPSVASSLPRRTSTPSSRTAPTQLRRTLRPGRAGRGLGKRARGRALQGRVGELQLGKRAGRLEKQAKEEAAERRRRGGRRGVGTRLLPMRLQRATTTTTANRGGFEAARGRAAVARCRLRRPGLFAAVVLGRRPPRRPPPACCAGRRRRQQ